ncbi:MAG: carboxy terminal-processing peptidase [Candidatus Lambdaproteobacteria bacterium]|nr:carboxy terminal-processing peptidase [Candidatus Lambdaproteobacteria bacterium]
MLRKLILWAAAFVLLFGVAAPLRAGDYQLTGDDVSQIVRTFLRNHFAREEFDDAHSAKMLQQYLDQFDPEHVFFLQSDVDDFQRYSATLDEQLPAGNIDLALRVYERIKQRMGERQQSVEQLLAAPIDLKGDESILLDRSKAPYPADTAQAAEVLRKKIKLELLQQAQLAEQPDDKAAAGAKDAPKPAAKPADPQEEARKEIAKRYRNLHLRIEQYNRNDIVTAYLNAYTKSFDPHSAYLSQDDLENFNIALRLSLEGIGATLRWEDGYTIITTIIPGGAASREGTLKPEDKIVAVAQGNMPFEDVRNMRLGDVVKMIRGKRGTVVRLAYLRTNKRLVEKRYEVAIVRDRIELKEGEASGKRLEVRRDGRPEPFRVGIIDLPSFYVDFAGRNASPDDYKSSSRDVEGLLEDFVEVGVDGLILDLRNNGGGGLDEAVSLAGLFLNAREPVVMVKNIRGRVTYLSNPHEEPLYRGPLLVLTNRYSASASEIVAGALKDFGRSIVVGESSTFGKGTVQNVISLPRELGALKTTVAKFYRPGSSSTQHRGVASDIVLPSLNNHMDIGESSLANAMPWDAVRPASFQKWDDLSPVLPALEAQSRMRRSQIEFFRGVESQVQDYLEHKKGRRAVSMKEILSEAANSNGAPSGNGVHRGATPGEKKPEDDPYLVESANILVDYILLKGSAAARRVVSQ